MWHQFSTTLLALATSSSQLLAFSPHFFIKSESAKSFCHWYLLSSFSDLPVGKGFLLEPILRLLVKSLSYDSIQPSLYYRCFRSNWLLLWFRISINHALDSVHSTHYVLLTFIICAKNTFNLISNLFRNCVTVKL